MRTFIYLLTISSIEIVYGGLLGSILGSSNSQRKYSRVNSDGILHTLNPILGSTVCALGLACYRCKDGILKAVDPVLGGPLNQLGIGDDCELIYGAGYSPTESITTKAPITQPPITEPTKKSDDCFDIDKPIREPDTSENESANNHKDNDSCDCSDIGENDWEDCDDEESSCSDIECSGCDDSICNKDDCAGFDCSFCGLIN